jgi:hypothetical protein
LTNDHSWRLILLATEAAHFRKNATAARVHGLLHETPWHRDDATPSNFRDIDGSVRAPILTRIEREAN